jgi:BirA family biotin operon repressor/biotin-[acetyl-CoA-carboxylase] ligase
MLEPVAGSPLSYLVMLAALSVCETVAEVTGLTATLKWPNDVLINGKKVCGILAETSASGGRARAVVGIGLNVNLEPRDLSDLPATSTSLRAALGKAVSREDLAQTLFKTLDMWYRCFTRQPEAVFAAWAARLETVGRSVLVVDTSGSWKGTATTVLPDGGLVVQDDDGDLKTVYAADVSIRNTGDYTGP